ncbi:hypothetical protein [Aliiglaciecola litoralis]|uniref:Lipoprotein n=1 Tax=Aliiglaciecola litoralis TaxID=582857 RepID=A0ABN1LCI6_9ALTE
MRICIVLFLTSVIVGCATKPQNKTEIQFSHQQHFSYFGYITAWTRKLGTPSAVSDLKVAEYDFSACKRQSMTRYIDHHTPNKDIRFAFMVECMANKGWFLVVEPYMVTR